MHKSIFLLLLICIPLASAAVTQNNTILYGITETDGTLNITSQVISNTSILGFVCATSNCSITSGTLWSGIVQSGANTSVILEYPTVLQDQGYGIFFFKENFIPYEVKATWSGEGQSPAASRFLTQKRLCSSNFSIINQTITNQTLNLLVQADSPIAHAGPLSLIPAQIASQYTSTLNVTSRTIGPQNQTLLQVSTLPFSSTTLFSFTFNLIPGNYTVEVETTPSDQKCLAASTQSTSRSISITSNAASSNQTSIIPSITIISPQNITYTTGNILVNISAMNATSIRVTTPSAVNATYTAPFFLNLGNGSHSIFAEATSSTGNTTQALVFFSVNTTNISQVNQSIPSLQLSIISPENSTYTNNTLLVNISTANAASVWFSVNTGINQTYSTPLFVTFQNGSNILTAYANSTQGSAIQQQVVFSIASVNQAGNQTNQTNQTNTPPAAITNLTAIAIGQNFITWNWTNPADPDFAFVIISLNGVNVANTSSNQYNATGLIQNTQYTISIRTQDTAGNRNNSAVNNTQITLSVPSTTPPGGGGGGGSSGTSTSQARPALITQQNKTGEQTLPIEYNPAPVQEIPEDNNYLMLMLLASLIMLLLVIGTFALKARKTRKIKR
ncbi:fibronectin type III domain-containing protein [Candidatus Pacearchaeota archaeon]|nr:fibronectin type III domain-containing protein [Candidatus Pacearchaeota archaeon]